jgi:hypothetical protein
VQGAPGAQADRAYAQLCGVRAHALVLVDADTTAFLSRSRQLIDLKCYCFSDFRAICGYGPITSLIDAAANIGITVCMSATRPYRRSLKILTWSAGGG